MQQLGGTGIIGQDMIVGFSNGKYTQFEGTEISIENCLKAKVKDLVVEGKTYQNLVSNLDELVGNVYTRDTVATIDTSLFKANTTYTAIITISESNYSYEKYGAIFSIFYPTLTNGYVSISLKDGTFKLKFTTKEETPSKIQVGVQYGNSATSSFKLDNLIIFEGDYTNIDLPTSIDGIESVGEKEDINLLKNIAWYDGFINMDTGEIETSTSYSNAKYSELIDIDINQLYKTNIDESGGSLRIRTYKSDGTYIKIFSNAPTLNSFANLYEARNIYAGIAKTGIVKIRLLALDTVKYPLPAKPYVIENNKDINYPYPINLNNKGKNLFNLNNLESGSINPNSGTNVANPAQVRSINFIEVKPSTSYMFNDSCRIFEYSKTKGYIGSSVIDSQSFITSSNTYFLKLHKTMPENGLIEKIQLEEGTVATSYESYREPSVTTLNLPIPLRSLPNGVADTIEGNKLVQRVGKVIFNGSEDWKLQSVNYKENGLLNVYCLIEDLIVKTSEKQYLICNKYIPQKTAIANTTTEGVLINNEKRLYLRLFLDKATTVAEAKEYIKNNPFVVYYELETPIIHDLEIPQLSTTKGTNIITTENNIKPNLKIKVKVKK